jgi:PhnB protein
MADKVKAVPDGYEGATPYLICKNAGAAIDFYVRAFGAVELLRIGEPGMVGHAEIKLGGSIIMLADEYPAVGALSPETIGGSPISLMVYVENVDEFTEKAVAQGLQVLRPVKDQFYGDRVGHFVDPFGHKWYFATHLEDLTPEEIGRRAAEKLGGGSSI